MSHPITQALIDLFSKKRVVFWYDEEAKLKEEFEAVDIPGVEKLLLANNELEIKVKIVQEFRDQRFLVYAPHAQPADTDNWLLDLNLAYPLFHSDESSLFLQEMQMDPAFRPLVLEHLDFFRSKERRERLIPRLKKENTARSVRMAMIASIVRSEPDLTSILLHYFDEARENTRDSFAQIVKFGLGKFFWAEVKREFHYEVDPIDSLQPERMPQPTHMLTEWFDLLLQPVPMLKEPVRMFFTRWKDSKTFRESFRHWSDEQLKALNGEAAISHLTPAEIGDRDDFSLLDKVVVGHLIQGIAQGTLSVKEVRDRLSSRQDSFWMEEWQVYYGAIEAANQLREKISQLGFPLPDPSVIARRYMEDLHLIDRLYRQMIGRYQDTGQDSVFGPLIQLMESRYLDDFLIPLQREWDKAIDDSPSWPPVGLPSQQGFAKQELQPFMTGRGKALIIISDAFRYESARELYDQLLREKGVKPSLQAMVTGLPSVTKSGMAALLPHQSLRWDFDKEAVLVDNKSSVSTPDRSKILQEAMAGSAIAMKFLEFNGISSKTQIRDLIKTHEIIYLYHNLIDQAGESHVTEENVFKRTEEVFEDLKKCIKKYMHNGGSQVLITADHGYLYQQRPLDATDVVEEVHAGTVYKKDQRYMQGESLSPGTSVRVFKASEVGFEGTWEVAVPKGIQRFPAKGTKRYVHGGASLQEVLVPLLLVSKRAGDDRKMVEVDVLQHGQMITTSQLKVSFFQRDPISDQVLPRSIRAAFVNAAGEVISNQEELVFESQEEESRLRQVNKTFSILDKTEEIGRRPIYLLLEESVPNSASKWKEYNRIGYTLNISILRDFDF